MTLKIFTDGEVLTGAELNALQDNSLRLQCLNLVRQLIDRSVSFDGTGFDWGEAYIDTTGRKNSVNTGDTDATFTTDSYETTGSADSIIVHKLPFNLKTPSSAYLTPLFNNFETGCDVNFKLGNYPTTAMTGTESNTGFNDPDNAFDLSNTTYATSDNTTDSALGKTFASTNVYGIKYKFKVFLNYSGNPVTPRIQTWDGGSWTTTESLSTTSTGSTTTKDYEGYSIIDADTLGVRLLIDESSTGDCYTYIYCLDIISSIIETAYLNHNELVSFSELSSPPSVLTVKLIPKTVSPTAAYPSIKGVALILGEDD